MYRYLGIKQSRIMEEKITKQEVTIKYLERVKSLAKRKLYGRNLIKAINTYAIPLLVYTFGIINWTSTDIQDIKRKTNKILTNYRYHHIHSATERLPLPRAHGGRGLIDIANLLNRQKNSLKQYFKQKARTSHLHQAVVAADTGYSSLNLSADTQFTTISNEEKHQTWLQKALHGRHAHILNGSHVDKNASNVWLTCGKLFPETEGFMCAIQDQVICTKNYKKYIIKDGTVNDKCRRCNTETENIQYIVTGCQTIANTEYKSRHDDVAKILHEILAFNYQLLTERTPYYKYSTQKVLENEKAKIYWDRTLITDITISHNRPDITVIDRGQKKVFLIDVAVPDSNNLQAAQNEKIRKYSELVLEIKQQWHFDTVIVVPVVLSATGVIPHTLQESLTILNIPSSIYISLQKAVILSTCRIVRKFLGGI